MSSAEEVPHPLEEEIVHFMEVTGADRTAAIFHLEAAGGSSEMAISMFFEHGATGSSHQRAAPVQATGAVPPRPPPQSFTPPRPRAPVQANVAHAVRPSLIGALIRLPFTITWRVLSTSLGLAAFFGDRLLPARVMRALKGTAAIIAGRVEEVNSQAQARAFVQAFKASYGDRHPRWVEDGLRNAGATARSEHRFLFAYLHAPEHEDTQQFCQEVLCSPEVVEFANANYVCWGGDISAPDAYMMASRLGATTYPFAAMLSYSPDNKMAMLACSQGRPLLQPGALLGLLTQVAEEQGALLVAQRAEQEERDFARQLREEQNREFEESLAADRAREAARSEERRKAEEEAAAQAAAEAAAKAAQEAEEKRKADLAAAIASRRERKQAALQPEPAAGSEGAALVRVRLPDGANAQRSFAAGATVGCVFDFVDSLPSTNYWSYSLVSNFPRRVFAQADAEACTQTLADAGLTPQAALFVQPGDE